MESFEIITAKLVLGYLKSEKCKTAYREFLKTSSNLRNLDYIRNKYMTTRFLGQTLQDILAEYLELSQIIQGRLEATNYYHEHHTKSLLSEQLMYLLNKVPSSRASTPTASQHGSHVGCMSPDYSDVEATPVHTLPGNTENDETLVQSSTPRKKLTNRHKKSSDETSPTDKSEKLVLDTEVLAQNLMENVEFQEKIAQTINKVVERQHKEQNCDELDKTIKSAVEETQADPLFEELLQEILDSSTANAQNNNKDSESSSSAISATGKHTGNTRTDTSQVKVVQECSTQQQIFTPLSSVTQLPMQPQIAREPVLTYDNPLDGYLVASSGTFASGTACIPNPVYINAIPGLIIPAVNTPKPLVVINKPETVLTEQDIMKMPIILRDGNDDTVNEKQKVAKKAKLLYPKAPKQKEPEASVMIQNYFKNYVPEESEDTTKKDEKVDTNESLTTNKTVGLKKVIYPKKTSRKSPNPTKRPLETIKETVDETNKRSLPTLIDSVEKIAENVVETTDASNKINTPLPPEPVKKPTPKSGSHVRNLDFSTPPKLNSQKKPNSPIDLKHLKKKDQASKTLFKTKDLDTPWDSDLRAPLPKEEGPVKRVPTINKKGKKKGNKSQLNTTTEQEALLLEAAMRTPIKKVDENEVVKENDENQPETSYLPENSEHQKHFNSQVKTILSPSKLNNASKHILEAKSSEADVSKFITPDMPKASAPQPIKANRNIMPMLETPVKLPKTPGASTPLDINLSIVSTTTPFTKMLEANLDMKGLDIGSIPTPLPITPGFPPFTPTVDLISPYSNRPTDYSTSSSYYQPSDNEQNKNLEAHLREIEKTSVNVETESPNLSDRLQMFNKNIIGKKNLSLMKNNFESDSFDSSSDSEDEEEKQSSSESYEKDINDTVIIKNKVEAPRTRYSLRARSVSDKSISPKKKAVSVKSGKKTDKGGKKETKKPASKGKKIVEENKTDSILKQTCTKVDDIKTILSESKPETLLKGVTSQMSILSDLEKKKQRTLDSLKHSDEPPKVKKQQNSKFKIKPIAKVYTSKKPRKNESPKKRKRMKGLQVVLNDLITSDDSDFDLSITISDEETDISKEEKESKHLNTDKIEKTASDVEAQNLIEGLKERGIHLMQNKSPKKKNIYGNGKEIVNTSATHLDTIDRESFDVVYSDKEVIINVVHQEKYSPKKKKIVTNDDHKIEYVGQLYLESIQDEIIVHLKQCELFTLIEIDPSITPSTQNLNDGENSISSVHEEKIMDTDKSCTKDGDTKIKGNRKEKVESGTKSTDSKSKEKSSKVPTKQEKSVGEKKSVRGGNKNKLDRSDSIETTGTDENVSSKRTKQKSEKQCVKQNHDVQKNVVKNDSVEVLHSAKTKQKNQEKQLHEPDVQTVEIITDNQKAIVQKKIDTADSRKTKQKTKEKQVPESKSDKQPVETKSDRQRRISQAEFEENSESSNKKIKTKAKEKVSNEAKQEEHPADVKLGMQKKVSPTNEDDTIKRTTNEEKKQTRHYYS